MEFSFSEEQIQIRETVARFLAERNSSIHIRQLIESKTGYDHEVWTSLGRDLGLGGIHVPTEFGGAGLSYVETCLVLEQMGYALYGGPFFSSNLLSVNALLCCGTTQAHELIPDIVSCNQIATVAFTGKRAGWARLDAPSEVNKGRLNGEKSFVTDGLTADYLLVIANDESEAGRGLYVVDSNDSGVNISSLNSLDFTRRLAHIEFQDVPTTRLGDFNFETHSEFVNLALVGLANEMVGGAQRMLDSAIEYSGARVQFGRTIGSLQAIKHKCSELLMDLELAKSAAYRAAAAMSEQEKDRAGLASIAKAMSSDVFVKAASDCIQIHGGIGFTWENDTHLWYRRAKSSEVYLGDASHHREQYLQSLEP